ncbi:ATP-grasp domain-containing protein [bacterium]
MKVAIIYNKDFTSVINTFGIQNKELYNPATVERVRESLEKGGHNVEIIDGNMHVIESLQHFMPKVIEGERMGMVFNMAYGIQGESRYTHIPSLLEMLGIPYVGSTPAGHALALDKIITKILMMKNGIPTPDFWVFDSADEDMSNVYFPVIVKPKMEAVSFGLRVVHREDDLKEAVAWVVQEFQQQALVEQFIRGREFAVGLIGNNPVETFPVLEIDLNQDPDAIQTVDDKKKNPRKKICPADLSEENAIEMRKLSVAAFNTLGLRDFSRVDIRMDEAGNIYLLEINSMASMGLTGSYFYAATKAGYDYTTFVNKMLDVAAVRYFASSNNVVEQSSSVKTIPIQTRIRGFMRSRWQQHENLLKSVVNQNTYVRNIEGVNQIGKIIQKQLELLGFTCEPMIYEEIGNPLFFKNTTDDELDVLLLGNLDNDTKTKEQKSYRSNEQKFFGTGIWEHKAGLVSIVYALRALRFVRQLRKIKIGVLLTTDSSLQNRFSKKLIQSTGKRAGFVIGLHGASSVGGAVTSRSGAAVYHCALHLIDGENASDAAEVTTMISKLMVKWGKLSDSEAGIVVLPSQAMLESNVSGPTVHAEITLSLRFNLLSQMEKLDKQVRTAIPSLYKKKIAIQIDGGQRRPPFEKDDSIMKLWQQMKTIADSLDIRFLEEHRWSSADICFIDPGTQRLDGMGPVGDKPTDGDEYILRYSLSERSVLLAMALIQLKKGVSCLSPLNR